MSILLSQFNRIIDVEVGGTAIGELIQNHYVRRFGVSKHTTAQVLRNSLGKSLWGDYKKFAIVRDPLSRAISAYNFLLSWAGTPQIVKDTLCGYSGMNAFFESGDLLKHKVPDNIFDPQVNWLCDNKGSLIVDKIFRVEGLKEDFIEILKYLDIYDPNLNYELRTLNQSKLQKETPALSEQAIRNIHEIYRQDYELLGYC